jgi:hypothetical protein
MKAPHTQTCEPKRPRRAFLLRLSALYCFRVSPFHSLFSIKPFKLQ